jgi:hypothetical protein
VLDISKLTTAPGMPVAIAGLMDINLFQPHELPLVLGALRDVALANGQFTEAEAAMIEGIAKLHGEPLDASTLPRVSPEQLACLLTDPHRRKRAVQLAIITSLVEGQPSEDSSRAVAHLARALDVNDEGLRVLDRVAHERSMLARFDMVRRVQRFATQGGGPGFLRIALPTLLGINRNDAVAARYQALSELPSGTLGRALYDHYREHGFPLPGEKSGLPELLLFHDIGHIISGYGVDPQGEIQQAAFQAGFARTDGFVFLLFGILQFHIGLRVTPVARAERGYFDVPKVLRALARGAACKVDFSDHFDFFSHANERVEVLRQRWGVPPLAA